jgi:hypothetical protein
MTSHWNPDHWKKYSDSENQEMKEHLQRLIDKGASQSDDYRQWIKEINVVLDQQQSA